MTDIVCRYGKYFAHPDLIEPGLSKHLLMITLPEIIVDIKYEIQSYPV